MIWAAVVIGLALTVFGASAAAALITVSRTALADAVSRRLRGAVEPLDWLAAAERELAAATATTALGIAVLAAGLAAVVQMGSEDLPMSAVLVLLFLVAVPFTLFSGYVLPRWLTARRASRVAELVRPGLEPWSRFLGALLPAPGRLANGDLRALWREGVAGPLGPSDELVMVGNVISFAERTVRDVMTPRTELVAIPEGASYDEIAGAFVQSGYSRLPVYRGTVDEIIGMVHVFDLLKISQGDPVPIRPVVMAPASRNSGDVLLDMQRQRRHLAVVLDEFGGTVGIVTLEDLLESMVGEIFDEHEHTAELRTVGTPVLLEVDGSADLGEIEERFGVTLPPGISRTVGGRLAELVGRIPAAGERFGFKALEFDIVEVSPNRVLRVVVRRGAPTIIPLDRTAP